MKYKKLRFRLGLGMITSLGVAFVLLAAALSVQAATVSHAEVASVPAINLIEEALPQDSAPQISVDHSQFPILQQDFETGPDVTAACLSCHVNAAQEIMDTTHWTWEYEHPDTGQLLGKINVINNFCVAVESNEPRCTSCHVGYGWADNTFDFTVEQNVDCLVCHDTTGTYKKFPTGAGHPTYEPKEFPAGSGNIWEPPDLSLVAQNVGPTSRTTCGACHFYGGGADGVKHGDMDSSLANPDYELDVHMDVEGLDFSCTTCHTSDGHEVTGSRYSMNSTDDQTCESCHTAEPHDYDMLNQHIERVACQTCHIPEYARGGVATKMWWDWSKAGELNEDGSIKQVKDENGYLVYDSRKGEFVLAENVEPEYIWFNGEVDYTLLSDTFDDTETVVINPPQGDRDDESARIWPMKIFEGMQPYDAISKTLVIPHLYGSPDAYWASYDWQKAITAGMEYVGAPYSGEYGFVKTRMYWPITHMVAPASEALTCEECHVEEGGRLDFAALGYTEEQVHGLTHFPPSAGLGTITTTSTEPQDCAECHQDQVDAWANSAHGNNGVGCVSCHTLDGEGQHPDVAYTSSHNANVCGACHLSEHNDWENSEHAQVGDAHDPIYCVDCHEPHTQQQMISGDNPTSCESCHQEQSAQMPGSTHAHEGVTCLDCHKVTEKNTGHTFTIQTDSCTHCHDSEIHSANQLISNGSTTAAVETEEEATEEQSVTNGANIHIPAWGYIIFGLLVGGAGYWLVIGKEPGVGTESMSKEKDDDARK